MRVPVVLCLCSLFVAPAPALAEEGTRPVTQPVAAEVAIDPVPAGRRLIQLPGIEFPLRLAPACASGQAFDSLSISIADTRKTFSAAEFASAAVLETRLQIPGRQIGPIAVDGFCVTASSAPPATVNITDAFTANVAVRCNSETQQFVSYATLALEIMLVCRLPDETADADHATAADPAGDENQDVSSFTRF